MSSHTDDESSERALPRGASAEARRARYAIVEARIAALLEGEDDDVAIYATASCELHRAFEAFDWTGFYRVRGPELLVIGPYQGGHGCLRIPFSRGVCGAAARTRTTQLVPDVSRFEGHIACASSTQSEIVVPVIAPSGALLAVLDVDSNDLAAFDEIDREALERIARSLGAAARRSA